MSSYCVLLCLKAGQTGGMGPEPVSEQKELDKNDIDISLREAFGEDSVEHVCVVCCNV